MTELLIFIVFAIWGAFLTTLLMNTPSVKRKRNKRKHSGVREDYFDNSPLAVDIGDLRRGIALPEWKTSSGCYEIMDHAIKGLPGDYYASLMCAAVDPTIVLGSLSVSPCAVTVKVEEGHNE